MKSLLLRLKNSTLYVCMATFLYRDGWCCDSMDPGYARDPSRRECRSFSRGYLVHEKIDNHQYNHRNTQQPPNEIFTHDTRPPSSASDHSHRFSKRPLLLQPGFPTPRYAAFLQLEYSVIRLDSERLAENTNVVGTIANIRLRSMIAYRE